ncbi:unnamed protein product, partial [marine sediment metagenome]
NLLWDMQANAAMIPTSVWLKENVVAYNVPPMASDGVWQGALTEASMILGSTGWPQFTSYADPSSTDPVWPGANPGTIVRKVGRESPIDADALANAYVAP